jgi:hypothetical protein
MLMKNVYTAISRGKIFLASAISILLFSTTRTNAQGASCSAATALTVNGTSLTGTISDTTINDPTVTACAGETISRDGWYQFTATTTTATVTCISNNRQLVLYAYSGTCGSLSQISCANADTNAGGQTETMTLTGLIATVTYYVRVVNSTSNNMTINGISVATPIANDDCLGATALTVSASTSCTVTASGTTVGATQSIAALACNGFIGNADDDVWYSFTATSSAHTVTVTGNAGLDAVVDMRSGTCNGSNVNCADATFGGGIETFTSSGLTIGTIYYVRVYSYATGTAGTFTICVTTPAPPPSNDNCTGSVSLTVNSGATCSSNTSGTTIGASQSQAGCVGTADDDVWFNFTATGTSHIITVTPGTLYDAVFQVFSGTCGGTLTSISCTDATVGTNLETVTLTGLTSGTTYFVRVYSYYNLTSDKGTFTICVTTPVPLTNNNCATATPLTVNPTTTCTASTVGSTIGASQSQAGCAGTADDDVWYSFVAISTSHNITVTPGTLYDAVFQVFSGTCAGTLTSIDCIDDTVGTTVESTTLTGLTIGTTYFVRIYSYSNAINQGTFTICMTTEVPCTVGAGSGITDLGCPSVVSGGLGLNGADPSPISCSSSTCVDLEATYLQLGQPTSYTVQSIPYVPPYQFACLANPVSVNNDDVWSPVISLPFNFCFYGNTYNQCLISSNGAITFDQTNNTPGGYSTWSFANNLPSTTLFKNAIFGVYHDIDPRVGGEVGWELITLNTGCRALVASWNDIPMFSTACNSQLYSGMVVLYENTNIIDVFIEEKNVCGSWNSGNAIVGLQNAAGTAGIAAPNRNALDADWTVTNEAWRFVPSGTSITSLKWYQGAGTSGPVVGTTDVINVCPSSTTTYTAEVTYTLCNGTTVKETEQTTVTVSSGKVWNGSANTDWDAASNWTPTGVPTAADCVTIPNVTNDPIISGSGYNAYAYSLAVLNGGNLVMNSNTALSVVNAVNVNTGGIFLIKDDASLIQTNSVVNSGIVTVERITPPVYRFDYTYWNAPVTLASNYTLGALSPNTQYDKYYSWIPSVSNGIGNWAQESIATIMDPRKGYIVRAPNSFSFTPTVFLPYTATFSGTPNNGDITCPITYGTLGAGSNNDKWNLLGNPYPCAVSAAAFLNDINNALVIDGTIYFWTHNSAISVSFPDPFYGDYVLNYTGSDYASWNKTGGVGTTASSGGPAPNGYIASCQSFFVKSLAVPGNAVFRNSMRITNNNSFFFRTSNLNNDEALQRERIWLNMTNNSGAFNQILVGYVENATSGWDRGLDGVRMTESDISFYSLIPGEKLVIQGRPWPFDATDQVPLGYNSTASGDFSIRIDHYDGLFQNHDIYIEDKQMHIVHNLKESPYNFKTAAGVFDGRFILRYFDSAIGAEHYGAHVLVTAFISNHKLNLSASGPIEKVEILDITGKALQTIVPSGNNSKITSDFFFPSGVYLTRTELMDGSIRIGKLLH